MQPLLNWQPTLPLGLSEKQQWLAAQPSLTAALKSLDEPFSVRLLHLGLSERGVWFSDKLFPDEVFARDVLLCLSGKPVVWARSVCHCDDVRWREVLDCGTQPLGERLFDGTLPLARSPLEFCAGGGMVSPHDGLPMWALRRSVFDLNGNKLGLVECFL
ncbi:MAG: chorismate lyase [Neisseria sp.]|uniref:chorismate--pyruvate lyase family protein n=1 Tax=Neisseria sp. TaxID=192066 RepID=UPI0026DC0C7B|nr:chorismate lyase [Neisseria sp.]MDO4641610.1 chorismate lyase [Neisseria sp.]